MVERLRALEPKALAKEDPLPLMVLRGGIEFNEWFAEWCERMEQALTRPGSQDKEQRCSTHLRALPIAVPAGSASSRSSSSSSPRRSAARSPSGLTPTAPTTPRPRASRQVRQLQNAGFRAPGAIVIVKNAPVASPATRARVESIARELRRRKDVASVTGLLRDPLPGLRLQRRPLHLPRRRVSPDRGQAVAGGGRPRRRPARRSAGRRGGWTGRRPGTGQQAGRDRPAEGRDAGLPPPLPVLVRLLPQPDRVAPAGADRGAGDRRHLPHPARRSASWARSRSSRST